MPRYRVTLELSGSADTEVSAKDVEGAKDSAEAFIEGLYERAGLDITATATLVETVHDFDIEDEYDGPDTTWEKYE
jgi:hypothetical protein